MAPYAIELTSASSSWPLRSAVTGAEPVLVDELAARFPGVMTGPGGQQPSSALVLALSRRGDAQAAGVLILDDRGEIIEWVGAAAELPGRTNADLAGQSAEG